MAYYVYENWHRRRALLHRGDCNNCKNGQGKQPYDSGNNGKWHGPIDSRSAAMSLMRGFGYGDIGQCQVCKP
jgi:hypothetical protein